MAVTGQWAMWSDFNEINEKALHKAELLSGLPSMILLFLAFGSLIAAGLAVDSRVGRYRVRFWRAPPDRDGHAAFGLVDELFDDDRTGRRYRLQPLHRFPLPGRTVSGQESNRRDRRHDVDGRFRGAPVSVGGGAFAGGGLYRAGHGLPRDGAGDDPLRFRGRDRSPHPLAGGPAADGRPRPRIEAAAQIR